MTIALSGLIGLQYKWIRELIAVKEDRFEQTVNLALQDVVRQIEKIETAQMMTQVVSHSIPSVSAASPEGTATTPVVASDSLLAGYSRGDCCLIMPSNSPLNVPSMSNVTKQLTDYLYGSDTTTTTTTTAKPKPHAFLGIISSNAPQNSRGVWIDKIMPDSPASRAGLLKGDVITAVNGIAVVNVGAIGDILHRYQADEEITLTYKRRPVALPRHAINPNSPFAGIQNVVRHNSSREFDYLSAGTATIYTEEDSIMQANIQRREELIQRITYEISMMKKSACERIDPQLLQNTLTTSLQSAGVKLPYEYCLRTADGDIIYSEPQGIVSKDLLTTPYHTTFYQNEVFAQPSELLVFFPEKKRYVWGGSSMTMLGTSMLFNLIIILTFAYTIHTIWRQKKLSDMKTDFINNMTHELKTPISTIKLACEILTDTNMPHNEARVSRYANIISDENHRLQNHVEKVLQYARLEKSEINLNFERIDMHELINDVLEKAILQVNKLNGKVHSNFNATNYLLEGDEMHLTNVIFNIIDNAIKYAKDKPEITITTRSTANVFTVSIADSGIGMTRDTLKKIFDKFYRVPTGNIHNVKGFGLGLAYVKLMVEAHGGTITATSRIDKGSTFEISLPLKQPLSSQIV